MVDIVGIITVDIMKKETTEDMKKMTAIVPDDKPCMKSSVISIFKKIPWLLILMLSATFTSRIITHYKSALASYVILTDFIPMFMDTASNAGSQTSVTIIRGISLNKIKFKDLFKILWKKFRVTL